jgi:hypothetical protein
MAWQGLHFLACGQIPHLDGSIDAPGDKMPSVLTETDRKKRPGVTLKSFQLLTGGRRPYLDGAVLADTGDLRAIRAETGGPYASRPSFDCEDFSTRCGVPHVNSLVTE